MSNTSGCVQKIPIARILHVCLVGAPALTPLPPSQYGAHSPAAREARRLAFMHTGYTCPLHLCATAARHRPDLNVHAGTATMQPHACMAACLPIGIGRHGDSYVDDLRERHGELVSTAH